MKKDPVAFFLTWSAYGNWLHGDQRGSVDHTHNQFGTPTASIDAHREEVDRERMNTVMIQFDHAARSIITNTVEKHCQHRGWELLAVNVRTNHVHVVVRYAGIDPETMLGQFKAWASRRLRESKLVPSSDRIWTRHGSTRYIWHEASIRAAVEYVMEGQDVRH